VRCCAACFSDQFISELIDEKGDGHNNCPICGAENVPTVDTAQIAYYFGPLLALYKPSDAGLPLHQLVQTDWLLFAIDDEGRQEELLQAILADLGVEGRTFEVAHKPEADPIDRWDDFSDELKYRNRFLLDTAPSEETLKLFGEQLVVTFTPHSEALHRARVNAPGRGFGPADLLKPPPDLVTSGRANPLGIAYLYVASDPETAIAEVRGHKGDMVTVASFRVTKELGFYDLRSPRACMSPFSQLDDLQVIHEHLGYFESFERALSEPITPSRANLDYLPSQYLCEAIKKLGFHGILYGSSVGVGYNCVVFADEYLEIVGLDEYQITEMRYGTRHVRAVALGDE